MPIKNQCKHLFQSLRLEYLICFLFIVIIIAIYWQVRNYEFVYDDYLYVVENKNVQQGLSLNTVFWSLTAFCAGNWHPLTMLSHALDVSLYGMHSGQHHLTNVLFHIANTIFLFLIFRRITGKIWQSAFVAVLFAVHPLHVESVAWVSERKDMLSMFFGVLTIGAYSKYTYTKTPIWYLISTLLFMMGLMSKPMLVTWPFVLLLLDFWPLDRFRKTLDHFSFTAFIQLIYEKIPFFFLSAGVCVITILAQQKTGAIVSLTSINLSRRISNAVISYTDYIIKMFIPQKLCVFYPYPQSQPWWKIILAYSILISISYVAIKTAKDHPYLLTGWLWYLGTLIPVIGLVQVGGQSLADRYTYIPLIGLFIIISWGTPRLISQLRYKKIILLISSSIIILIFVWISQQQTKYWRNPVTLYKRAIDVTTNNEVAHYNLGLALSKQGQLPDAIYHHKKALQIKPNKVEALNNLGSDLSDMGHIEEAMVQFAKAIEIDPSFPKSYENYGIALIRKEKFDEAITYFKSKLKLFPKNSGFFNNLGIAFYKKGKLEQAKIYFERALKVNPEYGEAAKNLKLINTFIQKSNKGQGNSGGYKFK